MLLPRDDSGKAAPSDVLIVGWGGFIRHICGQTDITEKPALRIQNSFGHSESTQHSSRSVLTIPINGIFQPLLEVHL